MPLFHLLAWVIIMSDDLYKPGQKAPKSGQYEITGPRGGGTGVERTVTKNEPLPPPEQKGQKYRLIDPTVNQRRILNR